MKPYKNTGVYYADSSALGKALADNKPQEAAKIFKQTEEAFVRTVPNAEDRAWLMNVSKNGVGAVNAKSALL